MLPAPVFNPCSHGVKISFQGPVLPGFWIVLQISEQRLDRGDNILATLQ